MHLINLPIKYQKIWQFKLYPNSNKKNVIYAQRKILRTEGFYY